MMSVHQGDPAPDFSLPTSGGRTASLAGLRGKPFVLYFYPRADTPGCTREACAFQDALAQLDRIGLTVIGVSRDKLPVLEKFCSEIWPAIPVSRRRRRRGFRGVRHVDRENELRSEVHGDGSRFVPC